MTEWASVMPPFEAFRIPADDTTNGPAVYRWSREGGGSYIGACTDIWNRLQDHRRAGLRLDLIEGTIYPVRSMRAALWMETALIWMLNPTENEKRPMPPLPVWAATLGCERPISGWAWFPKCGHITIGKQVLGYDRGCRHRKTWNWSARVRSYVAEIEEAVTKGQRLIGESDGVRQSLEWARRDLETAGDEMERLQVRVAEQASEIERLEDMRDLDRWTP